MKDEYHYKETFFQEADDGIPSHWVVQYYKTGDPWPISKYFSIHSEAIEFEKNICKVEE